MLRGPLPVVVVLLLAAATVAPWTGGLADPEGAAFPTMGNHAKVHFTIDFRNFEATPVLGIEDANGDLVMYAFVDKDLNGLYVSDGRDGSPVRVSDRSVGFSWHRLDVVLEGDTYTLHWNQVHQVTARTLVHADAGSMVEDPLSILNVGQAWIRWAQPRVDDSAMAHDETFTDSDLRWETIETGLGAGVTVRPGHGHLGVGEADVGSAYGVGVTYLRAPTTGLGGAYGLEASVLAVSTLFPPHDLAVFAGLTGPAETPDVQWSLTARQLPAPLPIRWAVFLDDGHGASVQMSPAWSDGWHTVEAWVDEATGEVTVIADDGPAVTVTGRLGESTHVGLGDVFAGPRLARTSAITIDNLGLFGGPTP